jgi:hypothetical protein
MTAVPAAIPVTTPVLIPTVAFAGALLVQIPPGVVEASDVVNPTQTLIVPVIGLGRGFTVTTLVAKHPPGVI